MEPIKKEKNRDFSIIFKEVEKFHQKDSSINDNIVNEEDLQQDESIRAFGEICREINSIENNSTVFMTFS
ncbi:MAG: hypothetical protein J7K53_04185 [Bacteroidales bacterium]|nr:hypothetical protein [Bacteroidales bacterium]